MKPTLIITTGDPEGIGPEIVNKSLKLRSIKELAHYIVLGGSKESVLKYLDEAVRLIQHKRADALVTAPVNKEAINRAGLRFKGQTEYLATLTHTRDVLMMFVAGRLKVSLVTRHLTLNEVSRGLTVDNVFTTIHLTYQSLKRYFGIRCPKIGVCGLNPHAGEGGFIGNEEERIIIPALKRLKKRLGKSEGLNIEGPFASDSLFYDAYRGRFDAVVAMYHDQGLAPLKMVARDYAVNVTFGLPFIRTSPDHGTGYDIAGKGIADAGSMIQAIRLAVRLCEIQKIRR